MTPSTKTSYSRIITRYINFVNSKLSQTSPFPAQSQVVQLYISQLFVSKLAHSSALTHLSALNLVNKAMQGPDLAKDFWIIKLLQGYKKSSTPKPDTRLPITSNILQLLCQANTQVQASAEEKVLFNAMFILAFHGFLRVGEITNNSNIGTNNNLLQLRHIQYVLPNKIVIHFHNYKHSKGSHFKLEITSTEGPQSLWLALTNYVTIRGITPGPLFIHQNKPVMRRHFTDHLQKCLYLAGLDHNGYKSHSFRIGAATTAIMKGHTHQQVQEMGRWNSSAFLRYIRVQAFQL